MKTKQTTFASLKKVTKKVSEDDLEKIKDEDIADCVDEDSARIHRGDLKIDGDLSLFDGGVLIVDGNLVVSDAVATDETATLIVTGNVECRHVFLEGNLEVQGNLTARGVVYGFYEAGMSRVLGKTRARVGLIGNHDWECEDEKFEVVGKFSNYHELEEGDPKQLREVLGEKAFAGLKKLMGLSEEDEEEEEEEGEDGEDGNAAWGLKLLRHL